MKTILQTSKNLMLLSLVMAFVCSTISCQNDEYGGADSLNMEVISKSDGIKCEKKKNGYEYRISVGPKGGELVLESRDGIFEVDIRKENESPEHYPSEWFDAYITDGKTITFKFRERSKDEKFETAVFGVSTPIYCFYTTTFYVTPKDK